MKTVVTVIGLLFGWIALPDIAMELAVLGGVWPLRRIWQGGSA